MAEVGSTTGIESSLSNWAAPYVTDMMGKGWGLSEQPYTAYEGPLTAGPSDLQQQAFSGIANLTVPGGGTYDPSTFTSGTWNSDAATQYMNPYLSSALSPQLDELQRRSYVMRVNNAGRMTQAGSYGGSRQAIMESELDRNTLDEMGQLTANGYRDAYDRAQSAWQGDMGRNLQTQQMGEQSKQFGAGYGLDALTKNQGVFNDVLRAGETQRGIESEGIASDMRQFEQERDYPYKMTQFMQSLLQGLPLGAQSYNYTEPSGFNQFVGGASGIASLLEQLYGLGGAQTTPATTGSTAT